MRRETVNALRWVLEDLLPPVVRDSRAFGWLASLAWGRHIANLARFRARAPYVTAAEYEAIYRAHPRVQDETDNSRACVERVLAHVVGGSACDVGCGTGYLARRIRDAAKPPLERLAAVDFVLDRSGDWAGIDAREAMVEHLPFADGEFDTVVCTHVLEHILDIRAAVAELRRVCRRRLVIVVPREREYRYTFNPHFHFFPYPESFLRHLLPLPPSHRIETVGRDYFYYEDKP
jgi:SAM-dependent methyltransferase